MTSNESYVDPLWVGGAIGSLPQRDRPSPKLVIATEQAIPMDKPNYITEIAILTTAISVIILFLLVLRSTKSKESN
jgi:hypothetical protein